ncbi:pyridoxal phosphate-dependent aminotransferase [Ornithinimicrobium sp. F0845]|uniref:pyridoxal phosphate-dependent aminotransferase n=1 Tax=Ornithinimicrobium sp. F0845 TaxID=2926412 RepID=UPI001FF20969|nr:pyridoxal phosphate-dependent aminotransferase [Ornithinimicrobium sp. F0845]MCK0110563.1 pyridoxal phosphate-dependent aminotransferase [Ornithinimicrobium sp. F0845]
MVTASSRSNVEPFHVMEVLAAAAERERTHGDAIFLCAGQPSTPAPRAVREAAVSALQGEVLGYTEATGILPLRQAIAEHHRDSYAVDVDPADVIVMTGSSGAFTTLFLAAFEAGDRVAMTRPGYPAYRNTLAALGCEVLELDCGPETRYQPTVAMLEALPEPPKGLIVASPANPTGTVIDADELAAIARWCEEAGCLLISDEIYHGVTYGRPVASAWQTSRESVVVGSVSKYFSMTGWRLGWAIVPEALRRPMEVLTGNLNICPPAISQHAALAAFTPEAQRELDGHVARYAENRDLLLRRLPELGLTSFAPPDGAFYAWCDISHLTDDSLRWCQDVLAATGVALTPGVDFDTVHGHQWVRLSFAGGTGEIDEALDRLDASGLLRT